MAQVDARRHGVPGRRLARSVVGALVAVSAVVALAGCSATATAPRVAVIGDSTTALAQPDLSAALGPSYDPDYTFRIGVRTDQLLPLVATDMRENGTPVAAIVNVGTNDAVEGVSADHAVASFDQLLGLLGPTPCLVLTTIGPFADLRGGGDAGGSLNRHIFALADAAPRRVKVVDWNGFLLTLDSATRPTYLRSDLIHETPAGARWIAASDKAALATCGTGDAAPVLPASAAQAAVAGDPPAALRPLDPVRSGGRPLGSTL